MLAMNSISVLIYELHVENQVTSAILMSIFKHYNSWREQKKNENKIK